MVDWSGALLAEDNEDVFRAWFASTAILGQDGERVAREEWAQNCLHPSPNELLQRLAKMRTLFGEVGHKIKILYLLSRLRICSLPLTQLRYTSAHFNSAPLPFPSVPPIRLTFFATLRQRQHV